MQVTPTKRDGEVRRGVDTWDIVQLGVIGNPLGILAQPGAPGSGGRLLADQWKQVSIGLLELDTIFGSHPAHTGRAYRGCRVVHPMLQPGVVERSEDLERVARAVHEGARR